MHVHIWAEDRPLPQAVEAMRKLYPQGVEGQIAAFLRKNEDMTVTTSTMQDPDQGFDRQILDKIDVLVYWGHKYWREVDDAHVDYLHKRVLEGLGLIVLHSAHASKIFSRLMGTRTQCLRWRENDEWQRYWIVNPAHPIAQGIGRYFELPEVETYGEPFGIPNPDEVVFMGWYEGGEVFRSGCTFHRDNGRIFYFQPGHETFPIYYDANVQTVIRNAVYWARPIYRIPELVCPHVKRPGEEE